MPANQFPPLTGRFHGASLEIQYTGILLGASMKTDYLPNGQPGHTRLTPALAGTKSVG